MEEASATSHVGSVIDARFGAGRWNRWVSGFVDRWRDEILAYFDRRETSAAMEGLNNKARVVMRRNYGRKSVEGLSRRLVLEVNTLGELAHRTVVEMRGLTRSIQAKFSGYYT